MAHSEQVLQRFQDPQFVQRDETRAKGRAGSRLAGSQLEIHLAVDDEKIQAGFRAYGCPATIASADWLAEYLCGRSLNDKHPDRHDIIRALELGPARQHCAALAIEAMEQAFEVLDHTE